MTSARQLGAIREIVNDAQIHARLAEDERDAEKRRHHTERATELASEGARLLAREAWRLRGSAVTP